LTNPLEKESRTASLGVLHCHCLFAFTLQYITGKKYGILVPVGEKLLAVAVRIPNRISFGM